MKQSEEQKQKHKSSISNLLKSTDKVSYLRAEWFIQNIYYLIFLILIAVIYIWNNHKGVHLVRDLNKTESDLVEIQWYYNSTKDSLTRKSRQSAVADMVKDQNMYELSNPPYIIEK